MGKCKGGLVWLLALLGLLGLWGAGAAAQGTPSAEVGAFRAKVTDVRASTVGANRFLAVSLRIENKTPRPLILGLLRGSALATDDQGHRYVVASDAGVRGIGIVTDRSVDASFVLAPATSSDLRLELLWRPASGDQIGTVFGLDLVLRELQPTAAGQVTLGTPYTLQFRSLRVTPAATEPAAAQDLGPFTAIVTDLSASVSANRRDHLLRISVQLTNTTTQPLILAYVGTTGTVTDELGHRYFWGTAGTYDTSASGIGIVQGRTAATDLHLQPGEARTVVFQVIRRGMEGGLGKVYRADLVLAQLEILPSPGASQQVRVGRHYALGFSNLTAR
ncbi:hypothetical protein E7T06_02690 [Deinococcus sp. Arct2-2]|uniref:hypothetical protein n=1 Tax=Deinococcus sp. Arct2-2 TaxID=2568653 RepID=UPI0010A2A9E2|nr:hypothetical protein [Deinococcus sp. Arct2-2]THF71541.1 hypothetical protein E7T06_02690 [Deinococcus sp. Arct2-2]